MTTRGSHSSEPYNCTRLYRQSLISVWNQPLKQSRMVTLGCVKKCEQSLVCFCVVTLPEGQRRLGVYPRPVPGCGNRVQSGVAFGCRTPRYIPLLQTVLVRGCETLGGNTSRSLRKRRNFPQRHYPNTRRYDP